MATVPKLTANELQICIIIEHPDFHLQKKDVVNKNKYCCRAKKIIIKKKFTESRVQ